MKLILAVGWLISAAVGVVDPFYGTIFLATSGLVGTIVLVTRQPDTVGLKKKLQACEEGRQALWDTFHEYIEKERGGAKG